MTMIIVLLVTLFLFLLIILICHISLEGMNKEINMIGISDEEYEDYKIFYNFFFKFGIISSLLVLLISILILIF